MSVQVKPIDVGDVSISPIPDIPRLLVDPDEFFPRADSLSLHDAVPDPHAFIDAPTGRLVFAIRGHLLRIGNDCILVDCGVGNHKRRARSEFDNRASTFWMGALQAAGTDPHEVSTVIITHLHVDHVGWATRRSGADWVPTFPNATYLVPRTDFRYWMQQRTRDGLARTGDYLADSVLPLLAAGRLELGNPAPILPPEIQLEPAAGHTPGNRIVRVTSQGREALLVGDLVHHPWQIASPGLNTRYCCDSTKAAAARRTVLQQAAQRDLILIPAHFPGTGAGHVSRTRSGYHFHPLEA